MLVKKSCKKINRSWKFASSENTEIINKIGTGRSGTGDSLNLASNAIQKTCIFELKKKIGVTLPKSVQVLRNEWKSANYMKCNTLETSLFQLKYDFISKMWVLFWEMQTFGSRKTHHNNGKMCTFECYVTDLIEKCCWPFRFLLHLALGKMRKRNDQIIHNR